MRLFGYDVQFRGFSPRVETRGGSAASDLKDPLDWFLRSIVGQAQSQTGITVTPLKALGIATVFACRRVLADTISTLPLLVCQNQGTRRRVAVEHRLYNPLRLRPNKEMTSAKWREAVQNNLCLSSAGYSEILRDSDGDPIGAYPIETSRVDFYRTPLVGPNLGKLVYKLTDTGAKFSPEDVLHLRNSTFNGLTGLHTTMLVRDVLALAMAIQDNASKFFGNGSRPGGVLTHPMSLSADAQARLKAEFENAAGSDKIYRTMVLEEGMKYEKFRSENRDSQFLESKDAQNLEICRIFGVPPHKVGISSGQPRANIEEENIGFVMDTVRPLCVNWEQELDTKLFSLEEQDQGYCTYFDIDALLRGNMQARYTAYGLGRQWGILTANECRNKENLDAAEGGDTLLQPINMIDASKATDYLLTTKAAGNEPSQKQTGPGGKNQNT